MSNLQEENFNARKQIISGMKFFNDDIENFPVSTSLIRKVTSASSVYKRKLEEQKTEAAEIAKRQRLAKDKEAQIRLSKEAAEFDDNEIELAIEEAGKIEKNLQTEQKALGDFLKCMSTCKDGPMIQELIKQSQLSTDAISNLHEDHKKMQETILKLQAKILSRKH